MDPFTAGRIHARVTLDPGFAATFTHEGRTFPSIPMSTLSTGGFGLRLPAAVTAGMEAGQPLSDIRFEHPDLPSQAVEGVITHLLAQRHGNAEGFVLLGVQFVDPPLDFHAAVKAFVGEHLAL
jgi:hypothetical protein